MAICDVLASVHVGEPCENKFVVAAVSDAESARHLEISKYMYGSGVVSRSRVQIKLTEALYHEGNVGTGTDGSVHERANEYVIRKVGGSGGISSQDDGSKSDFRIQRRRRGITVEHVEVFKNDVDVMRLMDVDQVGAFAFDLNTDEKAGGAEVGDVEAGTESSL